MPCCGGKRVALKRQTNTPPSGNTRPVRYTGSQTLTVEGRVTGTKYVFSPRQPLQYVDVSDVAYFSESLILHRAFSDLA